MDGHWDVWGIDMYPVAGRWRCLEKLFGDFGMLVGYNYPFREPGGFIH